MSWHAALVICVLLAALCVVNAAPSSAKAAPAGTHAAAPAAGVAEAASASTDGALAALQKRHEALDAVLKALEERLAKVGAATDKFTQYVETQFVHLKEVVLEQRNQAEKNLAALQTKLGALEARVAESVQSVKEAVKKAVSSSDKSAERDSSHSKLDAVDAQLTKLKSALQTLSAEVAAAVERGAADTKTRLATLEAELAKQRELTVRASEFFRGVYDSVFGLVANAPAHLSALANSAAAHASDFSKTASTKAGPMLEQARAKGEELLALTRTKLGRLLAQVGVPPEHRPLVETIVLVLVCFIWLAVAYVLLSFACNLFCCCCRGKSASKRRNREAVDKAGAAAAAADSEGAGEVKARNENRSSENMPSGSRPRSLRRTRWRGRTTPPAVREPSPAAPRYLKAELCARRRNCLCDRGRSSSLSSIVALESDSSAAVSRAGRERLAGGGFSAAAGDVVAAEALRLGGVAGVRRSSAGRRAWKAPRSPANSTLCAQPARGPKRARKKSPTRAYTRGVRVLAVATSASSAL